MGAKSCAVFRGQRPGIGVWLSVMWLLVLGVTFALLGWLTLLVWSGWVRPLVRLREQVLALSRGEWNRLLLSEPLPGELWTVLLRLEGLRRALLDRLRSSTELNLMLEGEVARRSTDLARRNAELHQALNQIQRAREELLLRERLAAVGAVVSSLTTEIHNPIGSVVSVVEPLNDSLRRVHDRLLPGESADTVPEKVRRETAIAVAEIREMLATVQRGGKRAHDVVRAMRSYISTSGATQSTVQLLPLLGDLYQLFAERFPPQVRYLDKGVTECFDLRAAVRQLPVLTVASSRSDLSLLISRWLLKTVPRLSDHERLQIDLEVAKTDDAPRLRLRLADGGTPLDAASLALFDGSSTDLSLSQGEYAARRTDANEPSDLTTELRIWLPLVTAPPDGSPVSK